MELYIQIKDGKPFQHPMLGDNVRQAFPEIDLNNTTDFVPFIRAELLSIGEYEVYEGRTYEQRGDYYTDIHHVRPMTDAERAEVDAKKLETLKANPPGPNWVWNEAQQKWNFPPRPTSGGPWRFNAQVRDWVVAPEPPFPSWVIGPSGLMWVAPVSRPQDGQNYRWDEATLSWVAFNV